MKSKKRAVRRVINVQPLDSIDFCGLLEKEGSAGLDLASEAIVGGVGSVGVPLNLAGKTLGENEVVATKVLIGGGSIQQPEIRPREEDYTLNVGSQCRYTPPVVSNESFRRMLDARTRGPSCGSDAGSGCYTIGAQPAQIRGAH